MSQHKLLLADDSVTVQKVVNLTFADEGIEVMTVGDGDSAMEKVAEFKPDLVMADVNMPGLSGYEVCERIKSNPETSKLPVILLVGSFEPFDEAEARRVGADDYMTKPFQSIRQLVNKVTDLLGAGQATEEEAEPPVEFAEVPEPEGQEFVDTLEPEPSPEPFGAQPSSDVAEPFEHLGDTGARTLEMETPPEPAYNYGDAGMDDEMIEASSAVDYSSAESDEDDLAKTQPLDHQELKEFAFVGGDAEAISNEPAAAVESVPEFSPASIPAPSFVPEAPVRLDDVNPLDLPPLVEETGIRPAFDTFEPETISEPVAPAAPVVTEAMIADITARVADKLAERIARALDADVVREVTRDVLSELGEAKELS
ncbi:MAG: response regulator [Acidobacteria bacterium]|nr:response regulator [Acidobacteriota bacterium]